MLWLIATLAAGAAAVMAAGGNRLALGGAVICALVAVYESTERALRKIALEVIGYFAAEEDLDEQVGRAHMPGPVSSTVERRDADVHPVFGGSGGPRG